jgi:hypothetical protein
MCPGANLFRSVHEKEAANSAGALRRSLGEKIVILGDLEHSGFDVWILDPFSQRTHLFGALTPT